MCAIDHGICANELYTYTNINTVNGTGQATQAMKTFKIKTQIKFTTARIVKLTVEPVK